MYILKIYVCVYMCILKIYIGIYTYILKIYIIYHFIYLIEIKDLHIDDMHMCIYISSIYLTYINIC